MLRLKLQFSKSLTLILFTLFVVACFAQHPVSKQATLVETISSAEVLIEATGIYNSSEKKSKDRQKDVERNGVARAVEDAKQTAIYFVLYGGTDPIMRSQADKDKLEPKVGQFYDMSNVNRYVTYEDSKFIQKVLLDSGSGIKITKRFKVNKEFILRDLENAGIISSRAEMSDLLGRPQLMVIPDVPKGSNPIDVLRNDPIAKHAATVVESHLTAKQYEVLVPQQMEQLNTLNDAQLMLGDRQEDIAYKLALSIGSDVYITYSGAYENSGYNTKRFSMVVRAFETTTGRLLGAETGYSQGRQGESLMSIEEAMNGAIDAVLGRIDAYWREDMTRGVQYKLLISINPSYSEDDAYEIQDVFMDAVNNISKKSKENIATKQTIDYLVWVNPERYSSSRALFRDLKKSFDSSAYGAKLKTITINRKMIVLKVD
ncbi:MAG: hypothetical protein CVU48_05605 [Candidatus Cloacimonetes bacterium HGW-Cloacimonetes-1]|jgi:hypothetical protein|nr:MAG: hypothetical protein CVU48_05605 [Candidatus Cloacimonetes bacterium HGW-Cloacimonetes-1]